MIFRKHWTVALLVQKESEVPRWVKWIHEVDGIFHCLTCLKLHERWFAESKAPLCPQHENCHCRLEVIDYAVVLMNARANSNYRKFDPYLFDPENFYKHGKNKAFESWDTPLMMHLGFKPRLNDRHYRNMYPVTTSWESSIITGKESA